MANTVQIKRGNNTSVNAHTGPSGELIYNLDTGRLHAQDGSTAGGNPHALISDVDLKADADVTVSAGAGLTGGGTLAANRTLALSSASIASLSLADSAVQSVNGKSGSAVVLGKGDVGLSNVDNTSDASKPISTATQTALNAKANSSVTVSAGSGLTGGGNLTANRSIALNAASIASLGKADTALQAPGGTAGQVLVKSSNTTNDVGWVSSEAATAVSYAPQTLTPAQQVQARQNIQADKSYDSVASVAAATVPAFANAIRTNGYHNAGDGGSALYKRVASEPAHAGKIQSADGAWWELSERDVTVEMFGGVGSMTAAGVSSLSDIIPSLNDAVIYQNMNNGGKIYLTCKYYKQMTQFVFGNGSATQSSTINGIEIYGKSGKVTDAEFDASKSHGTTFQWYGPQSVNTLDSQVSILGPLNSCVIQDITFDGRGLRSTIFKANMMYFCRIVGVHCINWWFRGWHLETYSADYPIPGFSQWFFSNTFERCVVRMPVYGGPQQPHCAAWMGGDIVKNVGFSRNHFILCDFGTPDGASCVGLYLAMIDNNTFDRCFVFYDNGEPTGDGKGVYMERCGPDMYDLEDKFPCDNIFLNCPVFGGYHGASGTAGNLVIGYPTIDLQPEPNMDYLYVISCDGRMYGNMRGSAVQWAGAVNPTGLGTSSAFLSPVGYSELHQWADDAELIIPGDVIISVFTVSLGVAPGPGATRKFTIFKNGVPTAVSITFTSSQQGVQTWTYSNGILNNGVKFSRGDLVTIQSEVTGTPVNAKCKYSMELLPR